MRFSTREKFRIPTTVIDYLLSAHPKPPPKGGWQRVVPGRFKCAVVEESHEGGHRVVVPTVTIAKVGAYRGPLQMMLEVEAHLPNGDPLVVKCLVDTGAEANLIKKGSVPQHMTHAARKKLDLIAVNGQWLNGGGTRTINLELAFSMQSGGKNIKEKAIFNVMFWEA